MNDYNFNMKKTLQVKDPELMDKVVEEMNIGDIVKVKYSDNYSFETKEIIGKIKNIYSDEIYIDSSKEYESNQIEISLDKMINIEKIK